MLKRLRLRFVFVTMVITSLMLCILLGLVMHFTKSNLERQSVELVRRYALAPQPPALPELGLRRNDAPCIVLEIKSSGSIHIHSTGGYDLSDRDYLQTLVIETLAQPEETGVLKDYLLRYYRINTPSGQRIAYADISQETDTMNGLLVSCILIGTAGFLLFLAISLLLARWAIKPVEIAWEQQRQFVADASHELKTPLAVIMTNAELLQSSQIQSQDREKAITGIVMMSRQMRHLVDALLDLARIDNGSVGQHFESVDLSQLACEAVMGFEALFYERERILSEEIEHGIQIKGSRQHLKQVLDILLDNAQKYSFPHTEVLVTLRSVHPNHCLLTVASIGNTIPEAELKKIFARFYRVNPSRSRDGSYGLGLSIAERIIHDHKGKIWAESRDGINRFHIELPSE